MKAIVLTRGKIATVDDEDFERVNQFKWHALKRDRLHYAGCWSAKLTGVREQVFLHWFILGLKGVDHRNGDGLDNRRENLRAATKAQNGRALRCKSPGKSSQYRGVFWDKFRIKWVAQLHILGKRVFLGRFDDEKDAARAYDASARERFGEFAAPNLQ